MKSLLPAGPYGGDEINVVDLKKLLKKIILVGQMYPMENIITVKL